MMWMIVGKQCVEFDFWYARDHVLASQFLDVCVSKEGYVSKKPKVWEFRRALESTYVNFTTCVG